MNNDASFDLHEERATLRCRIVGVETELDAYGSALPVWKRRFSRTPKKKTRFNRGVGTGELMLCAPRVFLVEIDCSQPNRGRCPARCSFAGGQIFLSPLPSND